MASSSLERTQVFLCYSHDDKKYAAELRKHLQIYRDVGQVESWSDHDLLGGQNWRARIDEALEKTKVAVLLLSVHFFNSEFIQKHELPYILAAAEAGKLTILQVLVRDCAYKVTKLERFQFALPPAKAIEKMRVSERNSTWRRLCEVVERSLKAHAHPLSTLSEKSTLLDFIEEEPEEAQEAVREEREREGKTVSLPEEARRRLWARYREKLKGDAEVASMQVLGMSRALPVTDIYVMVRLHEETRLSYRVDVEQQRARDPRFVAELQREYLEQRVNTALDPVEALCRPRDATRKHFVIVGNPGAGKTTLLKRLAMLAIDEKLPDPPLLPLYVRLNEFASSATDDLLAFLLQNWQERYGLPESEFEPFARQYLEEGRALVLLDALDETVVGETMEVAEESYQRVSRAIMHFVTRFERAICAVTVRKAGYQARSHLPGFSELEVLDFRRQEIEQFVHKWFQSYTPQTKHSLTDRLLHELETRVHLEALAANPLLLSLIALDYEANLELPDDRARLYEECVAILLQRWDAERLITRARAFRPEYQKQLLPEIAWHFHLRGQRLFSSKELLPLIESFLKRKRVGADAEDVLKEIVSENGLLREQAHDIYGFLHLTLQEYFAAAYLSERHELSNLLRYLGDPWWEEVILLYAGHTYDASPLLSSLLQRSGKDVAPEDIFHSKLLLAGRCLAAHPMLSKPDLFDEVSHRLRDLLLATPHKALRNQVAAVLVEIARAYPDGEIWQFLLQLLQEGWPKDADRFSEYPILMALEDFGGPQLQRALKSLLVSTETPHNIRISIADILSRLKDAEIEQEMLRHLQDSQISPKVRESLAYAVGTGGDGAIFEKLCTLYDHFHKQKWDALAIEIRLKELLISDPNVAYPLVICYSAETQRIDMFSPDYHSFISEMLSINIIEYLTKQGIQPLRAYLPILALFDARTQFSTNMLNTLARDRDISDSKASFLIEHIMWARGRFSSRDADELQPLLLDPALNERGRKVILGWLSRQNDISFLIPLLRSCYQEFEKDEDMRGDLTFALAAQGEQEFFEELLNLLREKERKIFPFGRVELVKLLFKQADNALLTDICCQPRWNTGVRIALIDLIGQVGRRSFAPAFLETLKDRATIREVRAELTKALGRLGRSEEVARELLALFQRERDTEIKDELYTALEQVCRRANVTVVAEGPMGSRLRMVKR